jgi:DNA adenine methylase
MSSSVLTLPVRTSSKVSPLLKWAGGKGKILAQYDRHFPESFNHYFEPFLGGGAAFFHLYNQGKINGSFLSDANSSLINVYSTIKEQPRMLAALLKFYSTQHNLEFYAAIRSSNPIDNIERSARFVYLNRTCFNGLYRENSKGNFNVPMGKYKDPKICDESAIALISDALKDVHLAPFTIKEWAKFIRPEPGDFVYLDPPYDVLPGKQSFTAYKGGGFDKKDQELVASIYRDLDRRGVKLMLSNSDTDYVRSLFEGFKIIEILAPRAINSDPKKRSEKAKEVLVLNY